MKGALLITEKIVLWDTDVGYIKCRLKKLMKKKNINIYQLSRLADIKYDVLKRYCNGDIIKYDAHVLARLCYSLECEINDLLQYERSKIKY